MTQIMNGPKHPYKTVICVLIGFENGTLCFIDHLDVNAKPL